MLQSRGKQPKSISIAELCCCVHINYFASNISDTDLQFTQSRVNCGWCTYMCVHLQFMLQVQRTLTIKKLCSFKEFKDIAAKETGVPEARQLWMGFREASKAPEGKHAASKQLSPNVGHSDMPAMIYSKDRDEIPMCLFRDEGVISKNWTCNLDLMLLVSTVLSLASSMGRLVQHSREKADTLRLCLAVVN